MKTDYKLPEETDVVLIGAGIMSATLGMMLKELQPDLRIAMYERLEEAAAESSDAWNNAGTGHAAFCELNYTPEKADGSIETSKAVSIAESFEVSRQFWAYLIQEQQIQLPEFYSENSAPQFCLGEMIPSYGESLAENAALLREVRTWTSEVLGLQDKVKSEL